MSLTESLDSTENMTKLQFSDEFIEEQDANKSFQDAPKWLNKSYLENCLKVYFKDNNLRIHNLQACPALKKGENFCGVLTRITAQFETNDQVLHTGHYILKSSFEGNDFAIKTMEPYDLFNREMTIYEQVLPKLNALLNEINDPEHIFAETLGVDYKRSALIFEDLKHRNYVMPDRIKGLDMKLTKMILRKLAKMHATSAVLNEREKGCLEGYDRGMFNRHTDNYTPCFMGLLDACSRLLAKCKDYEHYSEKLVALRPMFMEYGKRVFDVTNGNFHVLAHGDFWTNNVMVKYDNKTGEPLDVILIDFQYAVWGVPAIDLYYFLNTSITENMQRYMQDELIQFYYLTLADTLKKLLYKDPIPSLHNFHVQLEEKAFYAFISSCMVKAVQRNEESENADYDALMKEDDRAITFKNTVYKNPVIQKDLKYFLPIFDRRGLLELDQ